MIEEILTIDEFVLVPPLWEMFERIPPQNRQWCFFEYCNTPMWFNPSAGTELE